jgi:hypothetical protein
MQLILCHMLIHCSTRCRRQRIMTSACLSIVAVALRPHNYNRVPVQNVYRLRKVLSPLLIPLLLLLFASDPLAAKPPPQPPSKQTSSSPSTSPSLLAPSCPVSSPSCAYVTLISTEEYVVGARVVQRMLRHFGSSAPMVAMVQQGLPHEVQP